MTEQPKSLHAKLATVMGKVHRVGKDGQHAQFKYASQNAVYDMIRPLLAEENVAFLVNMTSCEQDNNKTICWFDFTFVCGDTGELITNQWCAEANDKYDKGINKASAFATRYFLSRTFMVSTGDIEDDPEAADAPETNATQSTRRSTPKSSKNGTQGKSGQNRSNQQKADPLQNMVDWAVNEPLLLMHFKADDKGNLPHMKNLIEKIKTEQGGRSILPDEMKQLILQHYESKEVGDTADDPLAQAAGQ